MNSCTNAQELAALGDAGDLERVDSFLKRYSNAHASMPERTHTPVLRVNTPMVSIKNCFSCHAQADHVLCSCVVVVDAGSLVVLCMSSIEILSSLCGWSSLHTVQHFHAH